jgi:hypothetical protein
MAFLVLMAGVCRQRLDASAVSQSQEITVQLQAFDLTFLGVELGG